MATMKDVAKATGYSTATISRVFNGNDNVTPQTRRKIFKTAEKLGYKPNKMAAALRSGRSKTIGIVVPNIDSEVFAAAIKSMEETLQQDDYHVIISQSHESFEEEIQIVQNLQNLQVDGIIVSISKQTGNLDHLNKLRDMGVSVVLFDRSIEREEINSVLINNFSGAYSATEHLIQAGCKEIVHLAGKDHVGIFHERRRGYETALSKYGLILREENVIVFDQKESIGLDKLKQRLSVKERPDGIFAYGDIHALMALGMINQLGLRVPHDIKVVGFGNQSFCSYLSPGLSSIDQRDEDVGRLAASILLEELKNPQEKKVFTQQMLSPELVVRGSSRM